MRYELGTNIKYLVAVSAVFLVPQYVMSLQLLFRVKRDIMLLVVVMESFYAIWEIFVATCSSREILR